MARPASLPRQYLPVPATAPLLTTFLKSLDPTKRGYYVVYQPGPPFIQWFVWRHVRSIREGVKHTDVQTLAIGGPYTGVTVFYNGLAATPGWYWVSYGVNLIN